MRIGLYHGYEMRGSGSNEYTRYLARFLAEAGHEVHVFCREKQAEAISFVSRGLDWDGEGNVKIRFERGEGNCHVHRLPDQPIQAVYLTDKQREGNVKAFVSMSDTELARYHGLEEAALARVLAHSKVEVLHANHLVYQPVAALKPCKEARVPLLIYPHGSSIEYTIREDERFLKLALEAILGCQGLIIGNREVRDRILTLYPEHRDAILAKTRIVGVGVDTSLFQPVAKLDRWASVERLVTARPGGGKSPEQSAELRRRLAEEGVEATGDYRDSYNQALPDADMVEKLGAIRWNAPVLIFVGALTAGKGLQSLITAMPAILKDHPEAHLLIVGAGAYREVLEALVYALAEGDGELLDALASRGMELDRGELEGPWEDVQHYLAEPARRQTILGSGRSLFSRILFFGRLDHELLRHLFPCADLALFPSIVPEAYPLVLMESLSNSVLPLVSYFSGFRDGVDELEPWLGSDLVDRMKIPVEPEKRIEALVENVTVLLSSDALKSCGRLLRKVAEDHYDWRFRARQMAEAYRELAGGVGSPAWREFAG